MKVFFTILLTVALSSSVSFAQSSTTKSVSAKKTKSVTLKKKGAKPGKRPKKQPPTPSACDPGKNQIVLVNKSTTVVWAPGTKIKWKTTHGETGVFSVTSTIASGASVAIPITQPSPAKCKAMIRLP